MQVTLLTAGLVCVIGAILGGGLKAFEIEMPGLDSIRRQVLLGSVGTGFLTMSLLGVGAPADQVSSGQLTNQPPASPTDSPTATPSSQVPTGNLVRNPGAELGPVTRPFTVARSPEHWQQNALYANVGAYGDFASQKGCYDAGYPRVGQMRGTGERFFVGGYGPAGECNLNDGDVSSLTQDIDVSTRGEVDGWTASAKLGSYPDAIDGASLTVLAIDAGGDVIDEETTGLVTNQTGDFKLKKRDLRGTLPEETATVRIVLSFEASSGFSGAYADDVSFSLEP